ncbi:ABC transporter substrate-binding protein [Kibdelosporangium phytohabitans]|uniref:Sulfonate ABC transporter substrate-binding protein n=1 Tax=Kibdelosporangium phytohabitans TaxID=860235 RepID=A0A0N9I7T0_9PSEU|nr:ABC transporter substrate-binding protein [Kibdelosporangium phytohabitans]ALG10820.1 sulfonate ABC transporter substrate-binding protein [Kibdelosporangium phytohabitans]MBE1461990.1 NitT/TauT family transport system substrate-binding protein [Kibdelosporangium phytohabitans]
MRTRLLAAVLSVVGLLAVTSCAGSPAVPAKVTLGFTAWPGWLPWQVAAEKGFFAVNGVDVELKYFDSYTDSITALATGAIDANSQTLNDTLMSVSGGARQTTVLVNDISTGNDQIIARDGITSVGDLKGKTVAVEKGTVDHYLLLLALNRAKLHEGDVQVVSTMTDSAAAAFAAGHVDAVGAWAPHTTTALTRPGSSPLTSSAEFPSSIPDTLVVREQLAKLRPDLVQRIVNTWFETLGWIAHNPDEATAIMARRAGVSPQTYRAYQPGTTFLTKQENQKAFSSMKLHQEAAQVATFMQQTKLTTRLAPVDGLFDASFVNAP